MNMLARFFPSLFPPATTPPSSPSPMVMSTHTSPCAYNLSTTATSSTFTLPSGRKIGFAQYGSPSGVPIFYFHGLPGSRLEGAYYHEIGLRLGARIIGVDRPGIGLSDAQEGRKLLEWPEDVKGLAGHLGVREYAVMVSARPEPFLLYLTPRRDMRNFAGEKERRAHETIGSIWRRSFSTGMCLQNSIFAAEMCFACVRPRATRNRDARCGDRPQIGIYVRVAICANMACTLVFCLDACRTHGLV